MPFPWHNFEMAIYEFRAKAIDGNEVSLDAFRGKVLLIVNVASKCGFTPQYKGLESLFEKYKDEGFVVLGFPCNQFGGQEPGVESEILSFCSLDYGVTFPLFSKIDVNGAKAHPLYGYLKSAKPGILGTEAIKWNFTKFLVDQNGNVLKRYESKFAPKEIGKDIEELLQSNKVSK